MKNTTRMVFIALIVAQALVLHVMEGLIPLPIGVPGARLGLANIFTVTSLYTLGFKSTLLVVLMRVFLSTFFGGNLSSLMYSLAGGVLSLVVMTVIKNIFKDKVSLIGVSGAGSISHNIGQLLVASTIVHNFAVMLYLPILTFIGIGTGIFVGITANFIIGHLKRIPSLKKINNL